jgi:hypothetical protein
MFSVIGVHLFLTPPQAVTFFWCPCQYKICSFNPIGPSFAKQIWSRFLYVGRKFVRCVMSAQATADSVTNPCAAVLTSVVTITFGPPPSWCSRECTNVSAVPDWTSSAPSYGGEVKFERGRNDDAWLDELVKGRVVMKPRSEVSGRRRGE